MSQFPPRKKDRIFIGLGSNLGKSLSILREAWQRVDKLEDTVCINLSNPYLSSPVAMLSRSWFTNAVGEVQSSLSPEKLLIELFSIEHALGRTRASSVSGYQDRLVDLDLLYYGDKEIYGTFLTLPHPRLAERLFVLTPLAEIAPDFIDCSTNCSIQEMESQLRTKLDKNLLPAQKLLRSEWPSGGSA